MSHDSIPPARRGFQTGRYARAGRADCWRLRDLAHRRAALVRRHASGHARAGRAPCRRCGPAAAPSSRPRRPRRTPRTMPPTGCCRAAINRASCRPPAAAWTRLSTIWPARTRSAPDLHAAFTSADIDAVWCLQGGFGPGACWTCWTTNCCAATPSPSLAIATSRRCIWPSSAAVTFHGPMLAQDSLNGREEPTESALYAMVVGADGAGRLDRRRTMPCRRR